MNKQLIIGKLSYIIPAIGLLILFWTGLSMDQLHFHDESAYLENVELLKEHGFSKQFLLEYRGSAGPLFASLHYLLLPFTGMEAPGLYRVNLVFLVLTIFFLTLILKYTISGDELKNSLLLLTIPMIYVCAGLVLTEMPAIFFYRTLLLVYA